MGGGKNNIGEAIRQAPQRTLVKVPGDEHGNVAQREREREEEPDEALVLTALSSARVCTGNAVKH